MTELNSEQQAVLAALEYHMDAEDSYVEAIQDFLLEDVEHGGYLAHAWENFSTIEEQEVLQEFLGEKQEAQKQPIGLNEYTVLNYLQEYTTQTGITPMGIVARMYGKDYDSQLFKLPPVVKASYEALTNKDEYKVLLLFAQWGLENN